MYNKTCKTCGCAFLGKGPASLYCSGCIEHVKKVRAEKDRTRSYEYKLRNNMISKPGAGKGNNQPIGEDSNYYKHGWYMADRFRPIIKARRYCERCDKDLIDANRWMWVVHHRDHNHYNNVVENLELLCKRCHQIEHECHKSFNKSATTIPQGSRIE